MEKKELDELYCAAKTLFYYCCKTKCSECVFEPMCDPDNHTLYGKSLYGKMRNLKFRIEDQYEKMGVM